MKNIISKKILKKKLLKNLYILIKKKKLLLSTKYQNSFITKQPWYTFPCLEYIQNLDLSDKKVLEFGSGSSSIFWSDRCKSIKSIESDYNFFDFLKKKGISNLELFYEQDKNAYISHIRSFDANIIVIDGLYRSEITSLLVENIHRFKNLSLLIFDNSDWYHGTIKKLEQINFLRIDFSGFGPINDYTWTTSIFINRNFKINYLDKKPSPIGGLNVNRD